MIRSRHIFCMLALTSLLLIMPRTAMARATMIFWYPGEAGSTAEGQPVLDAFFAYLNQKIAPESVRGSYFNTIDGGLAEFKKSRPAVGIVSYAAWTQERAKLPAGATVLLGTLPSPAGTPTERYTLVGTAAGMKPGMKVIASEPLTLDFVRAQLFPALPAAAALSQAPQLLLNLKQIAEGKLDAVAILTPSEATSLARVSAAWSQALKVVAQSQPVPTARVVLFDPAWKGVAAFKQALLGIGSDPAARPLLDELRLMGFAEAK